MLHARQDSFRPSPVRRPPEGLKPLGPGILISLGFGANRSSSEAGAPRRRNGPQSKLACWLTPPHRQVRVFFHLCPVSSRVVVPTRRRCRTTGLLTRHPGNNTASVNTRPYTRSANFLQLARMIHAGSSRTARSDCFRTAQTRTEPPRTLQHPTPSPRFLHYTIRFARAIKLSTEGRYAVRVAGLCRALTRSLSPNRL